MNPAQNTIGVGLAAIGVLFNSGTAVVLNGAFPASPETALSGNTTLVTATYAVSAAGAPSYVSPNMQIAMSFNASNFSPVANGGATFIRAYKSDGTTVIGDFTVGSAWIASNVFAVGQYCTNGGNTYKCTAVGTSAASGGPTGTGTGIVDGTVTWDYVGAGQLFDFLFGNCNVQVGTPATFTQTLKQPAV